MDTEGLFSCWEELAHWSPLLEWLPNVGYRILKIPTKIFSLSERNWFPALISCVLQVQINIFPQLISGFSSCSLLQDFRLKFCTNFSSLPWDHILRPMDLIILIKYSEDYKLLSSSLYNFYLFSVSYFHYVQIFSSTLSSLNEKDPVSYNYKSMEAQN